MYIMYMILLRLVILYKFGLRLSDLQPHVVFQTATRCHHSSQLLVVILIFQLYITLAQRLNQSHLVKFLN